ncbi:MAG: ComEC/Rec2 family competence protein [Myxacorys chilensis ATA2-1-KO14]|nr:ComEC/Rec2 family competence protein [Myxacorys chilensis ATA2-1-KO14]
MAVTSVVIWCLAYILGLMATAFPWGGAAVLGCATIAAFVVPRIKPGYFPAKIWLIAGVIGVLASFYLPLRSPQPSAHDVSRFATDARQEMTVYGQVEELPRLTRSGKSQVWLAVSGVASIDETVDGKLYVTMPPVMAKDLYPGAAIALTGSLYKPKPALNPGGFDFQKYLAQEESFAGFKATTVERLEPTQKPSWGLWMVQQRIIKSQADRLGSPEGALLSAMVLGGRVVNVPFEVKDAFTKIGLSHALAASGFQVSLILGVVLALTRRFPKLVQVCFGATGLIIFLGLAGVQPAVLRAVFMGFAILIGVAADKQVKPIGSLLLSVTILLFIYPTWIWNLGFQLSVLATLGLLVTVPILTKWLDWLPSAIAPPFAVPIAAYIWTLPLQLYAFGIVSPYSILVNVIVTPLISILSIGGFISAILALASESIGSYAAWLFYYPTHWLIAIVIFFCKLPGNSVALGTISSVLTLALYGLICLPWLQPRCQRWWGLILLVGISLVFIPASYARANLLQVSAIATNRDPILIIQDGGRVGLVNTGDAATASSTVLPFLQKQGVNQIDWAIAANPSNPNGWATLLDTLPIKALYDLSDANQPALNPQAMRSLEKQHSQYVQLTENIALGSVAVRPLSLNPTIVQFQIGPQRWLWLKDVPTDQTESEVDLQGNQILWWSGKALPPTLLKTLSPKSAIAYAQVSSRTYNQLQRIGTSVYRTAQTGAIQWTPKLGFKATLESGEADAALL